MGRTIGTPGGFIRRKHLVPMWLLVGGCLAASAGIYAAVASATHQLTLSAFGSSLALIALVIVARRDDFIEAIAGWLPGYRGERVVRDCLQPLLAEGYDILHDLDIGNGNVDHIVVGVN